MRREFLMLPVCLAMLGPAADADWINDMIIDDCTPESRERIASSARRGIEHSVRRAEAAIEAPASIGDLGCLDGLMDMSIDRFAPVGPLTSLFSGSFDGLLTSPEGSRRICRFAYSKWNEVTRPLLEPLASFETGLPPEFLKSFNTTQEDNGAGMEGQQSGQQPQSTGRPEAQVQDNPADPGGANAISEIWNLLYGEDNR